MPVLAAMAGNHACAIGRVVPTTRSFAGKPKRRTVRNRWRCLDTRPRIGHARPAASTLKVSDAIFRGDVLQTAADGTLDVTFNDATTFSLLRNSQITVDDFVYQEHGKRNVAAFEVIKGTVSFVASAVAKTGDMRIDTPSAAIGIRGTAGIVETGAASEMRIKLYPDADGHVGRIEVFGRDSSQLGVLTGGGTGFLVRAGAPAVPLQISQQENGA